MSRKKLLNCNMIFLVLCVIQGAKIIRASNFEIEYEIGRKIVLICAATGVTIFYKLGKVLFKKQAQHSNNNLKVTFKNSLAFFNRSSSSKYYLVISTFLLLLFEESKIYKNCDTICEWGKV